jgi:hypothetical protein
MPIDHNLETALRQYILGKLDEEPRSELEERLITDSEAFELLGVTEDELCEEYLEESLPATERGGFENHFMTTPERHGQLRFLRMLKKRASSDPAEETEPTESEWVAGRLAPAEMTPEDVSRDEAGGRAARRRFSFWRQPVFRPTWAASLAALLVALITGNVWLGFRAERVERQLDEVSRARGVEQLEQQRLRTQVEQLSAQAQKLLAQAQLVRQAPIAIAPEPAASPSPGPRPTSVRMPTFALSAGLLRSEGFLTRITIPGGSQVIRLLLELPDADYPAYRATLYDDQGEEIWEQSKLTVQSANSRAAVAVFLAASLLSPGDYQLKLSGDNGRGELEPLASYSFRVTKP